MLVPEGTKIIMPGGGVVVLQGPSTIIDLREKEILVRNDDLWDIDRRALVELSVKANELENKSLLDAREIELSNMMRETEKQRSDFYKEQLEVREKLHSDAEERLLQIVKETKPSFFQELVNKGGWIGLLITIGVIIGAGL